MMVNILLFNGFYTNNQTPLCLRLYKFEALSRQLARMKTIPISRTIHHQQSRIATVPSARHFAHRMMSEKQNQLPMAQVFKPSTHNRPAFSQLVHHSYQHFNQPTRPINPNMYAKLFAFLRKLRQIKYHFILAFNPKWLPATLIICSTFPASSTRTNSLNFRLFDQLLQPISIRFSLTPSNLRLALNSLPLDAFLVDSHETGLYVCWPD